MFGGVEAIDTVSPYQRDYTIEYVISPNTVYDLEAVDRVANEATTPITVTEDATAPTVHVLLPVQAGLLFEVAWTGYDAGVGIAGFDVEYQVDSQAWTGWMTNTLDTEAMFVGAPGHTYTFRVTARDNVGNAGQDEASVEVYSVTKYYNFNGQRIAMRRCGGEECGEVIYLHGDHLGSVSLATNADGDLISQARYSPYGQVRWSGDSLMPTKFSFTGQRQDGFGLMDYHARFYSSYLNRWIQPDTIIPSNKTYSPLVVDYHETKFLMQLNQENLKRLLNPDFKLPTVPIISTAYDRYAYALNNPVIYTDPDGHNPLLIILGIIGAFIFFSQIPSDVYQPDPADWGDPGVMAFGGILMTVPTVGSYFCANDGDCTNEVNSLNNPTTQSVIYKLNNYLLNPNHPIGGSKAEWFKQALGFTQQNMGDLAKQIIFNPNTAKATELTQWGQIYEQVITITGANGKIIDVLFVWILNNDGVLRLVTSVPTKP